jgi:F-type H+-transporting ATPase subunit alpha
VAKYESGLYKFVEDRFPQLFAGLKEKQEWTDELKKLAEEVLAAYGDEFRDTIK